MWHFHGAYCRQTVSLLARHLENNGIPTVVLGSGKDIVEHCAVARFLFIDFPLGNPCGKPYDQKCRWNWLKWRFGFSKAQPGHRQR